MQVTLPRAHGCAAQPLCPYSCHAQPPACPAAVGSPGPWLGAAAGAAVVHGTVCGSHGDRTRTPACWARDVIRGLPQGFSYSCSLASHAPSDEALRAFNTLALTHLHRNNVNPLPPSGSHHAEPEAYAEAHEDVGHAPAETP